MKYKVIARNSISIVGVMGPFDSYKTAHAEAQHLADKVGHKKDVEVLLLDEKGMKSHGIDPEVQAIEDFNAFEKSGAFGPVQLRQNPKADLLVGVTPFRGTPVYLEKLTVADIKKRSPKGRGALHARAIADVHYAAQQKAIPTILQLFHDAMADAYFALSMIYQDMEAEQKYRKTHGVPRSKKYGIDTQEYYSTKLKEALARARKRFDEYIAQNRRTGSERHKSQYRSIVTADDIQKAGKRWRRNPSHDWIGEVDQEIEDDGTEGAFTRQARRAGYKNTMEFARKVMKGWRSGKKTVYNKRTKKQQRITKKTMNRANFAINAQKRRRNNPSHKPRIVDATGFGFYTVSPYDGLFALQNMRDGGLASMVLYADPFDARQAAELKRRMAENRGYKPIPVKIVPADSIPGIDRFDSELEIDEGGGFFRNPSPLPSRYTYRPEDAPTAEEVCKVRSWMTEYFESGTPKVRVGQVVSDTGLTRRKVVESAEDHLGYVMHGERGQAYFIPRPHRNPSPLFGFPDGPSKGQRGYYMGDMVEFTGEQVEKGSARDFYIAHWIEGHRKGQEAVIHPDYFKIYIAPTLGKKARRIPNPHLVVGETAKLSDQFMQWLEKYGSQYYTPYQIEDFTEAYQTGAEFDVEAQIPGGYEVYDGNKYGGGGPERRHADESLVAGDSLSTDWPGDNFEGIPPHRTES